MAAFFVPQHQPPNKYLLLAPLFIKLLLYAFIRAICASRRRFKNYDKGAAAYFITMHMHHCRS
jgi:hypothetical protein